MNNTFQIKRFGLLLKRQWLEFGRIYLISLLVVAGIIAVFYFLNLSDELSGKRMVAQHTLTFRIPLFSICGLLFISIVSSSYFAHMGQKSRAAIDLLIPASIWEKFLSGIFFTVLLSFMSYLFIFYLVDLGFLIKLKSIFGSATTTTTTESVSGLNREVTVIDNLAYFYPSIGKIFKGVYVIPFLVSSMFLLGSVYFNRFHYIKALLVIMIFSGLWTLVVVNSGQALFEGRIPVEQEETVFRTTNSRDLAEWGAAALLMLFAVFFWVVSYLRLKEKEV